MSILVPRQTIVSLLATALLGAGLATPATANCLSLSVDQMSATSGVSGDQIDLSISGMCNPNDDYFAWVWNGSQGFPIQTQIDTAGELDGLVGPVVDSVSGPIRLWKGKRIELPDAVIEGADGTFWIHDTEVFLSTEAALGSSFAATPGTTNGVTSTLVQGELRLDFSIGSNLVETETPTKGGPHKNAQEGISVMVVIQTCSPPPPPPNDDDPNSGHNVFVPFPIQFSAKFETRCFGNATGACSGSQMDTIARSVANRLGSQGIEARVEDQTQEVVISHQGCPIEAGFATATR